MRKMKEYYVVILEKALGFCGKRVISAESSMELADIKMAEYRENKMLPSMCFLKVEKVAAYSKKEALAKASHTIIHGVKGIW